MSPPTWVGISILVLYLLAIPLYLPLWRCKSHRNMSDLRFYHFLGHVAGAGFIAHEYLLAASYLTPLTFIVQCAAWIFIYAAISKKTLVVLRHAPNYSVTMGRIFMVVLVIALLLCGSATIAYSAKHDSKKVTEAAYGFVVVGFLAAACLTFSVYRLSSAVIVKGQNNNNNNNNYDNYDDYTGTSNNNTNNNSGGRKLFSRHTLAAIYTDLIVAFLIPSYTLARQLVSETASDGSTRLSDEAVIAALFCEAVLFTTQFCLHVFVTWELSQENDGANSQSYSAAIMSGLSDAFVPRYGSVDTTEGSINNNDELTASGNTTANPSRNTSGRSKNNKSRGVSSSFFFGGGGGSSSNTNSPSNNDEDTNLMIVTDSEARTDMQREHVRLRKPFLNALSSSSPFSVNFYLNRLGAGTASAGYDQFKEILFKDCANGSVDVARQLVESRDQQQRGWTLIHFAAAKRNVEALKVIYHELYSCGSDRVAFSVVDSFGLAPLHLAVLGIDSDSSSNTLANSNSNNNANNNSNNANRNKNYNNEQPRSRSGSQQPGGGNYNNNSLAMNSSSSSYQQHHQQADSLKQRNNSDSPGSISPTSNTNNNNNNNGMFGGENSSGSFDPALSSSDNNIQQQNLTPYDIEINNACSTIRFLCSVVKVDAGAVAGHGDGRNALHLAIMRNADIRIIRELVKANISVTTLAERYSAACNQSSNISGRGGGSSGANSSASFGIASRGGSGPGSGGSSGMTDDARTPDTLPTNPWFHHFASQLDYNGKSAMVLAIETNNWNAVSVMLSSATGGNMKEKSSAGSASLPPIGSQSSMMNYCLRSNPPSALRCGKCRNAPLLHIALTAGASDVARGMLRGVCEFVSSQHQQRAFAQIKAVANSNNNASQHLQQTSPQENTRVAPPVVPLKFSSMNASNSTTTLHPMMSTSSTDLASPPSVSNTEIQLTEKSPTGVPRIGGFTGTASNNNNNNDKKESHRDDVNSSDDDNSDSDDKYNKNSLTIPSAAHDDEGAPPDATQPTSRGQRRNSTVPPGNNGSLFPLLRQPSLPPQAPTSSNNNSNQQQQQQQQVPPSSPFPSWARALHKSVKDTTWSAKPAKGLNIFHCAAMGDVCPSVLIDLVRALAPPVFYLHQQHEENSGSNSPGDSPKLPGQNIFALSYQNNNNSGSNSLNNTLNNSHNAAASAMNHQQQSSPNTPVVANSPGRFSPPSSSSNHHQGVTTDPSPLDRELHRRLYRIRLWKELTCTGKHVTSSHLHHGKNSNSHHIQQQQQQMLAQILTPTHSSLVLPTNLQHQNSSSSGANLLNFTPKITASNNNNSSLVSPLNLGKHTTSFTTGPAGTLSPNTSANNNNNSNSNANTTSTPLSATVMMNNNNNPNQQSHHQHPRCPAGDGVPSMAWLQLWEHRFSRIGLHSCAKHLTELTKSSVDYLKKNQGGKLVQRIGNAALSTAAANEIIDAAEKFKVRELGLFVTEWMQTEMNISNNAANNNNNGGKSTPNNNKSNNAAASSSSQQPVAKAQDILNWSVYNRHYLEQQYSFLFQNCQVCNNSNQQTSQLGSSNNDLLSGIASSSSATHPLLNEGLSFASNASSAIMMHPTDSLQTVQANGSNNNNNNSSDYQTNNSPSSGGQQQLQLQPSLPSASANSAPNHHAAATGSSSPGGQQQQQQQQQQKMNRRRRGSSLSPQQQPPFSKQQTLASIINNNNNNNSMMHAASSSTPGGSYNNNNQSPPQQPLQLTTERKKALERLQKVMSIADVLDFVVGAKIGQVGPSYTPSTSQQGAMLGSPGAGCQHQEPKNISVPSFVRTASYGAMDTGSNASPNYSTGTLNQNQLDNYCEQQQSGNNNANDASANSNSEEFVIAQIKNFIQGEEKEMLNLVGIRKMLRVRAAYFGIKNTEADPQFTPIEIAFHRCHFAMFLAMVVLDETVDFILNKKRREIREKAEEMWNSSIFAITKNKKRREAEEEKKIKHAARQNDTDEAGSNRSSSNNSRRSSGSRPGPLDLEAINDQMPHFEILGDDETGSPRLASASLRESSVLSIEPLRQEILEQIANSN